MTIYVIKPAAEEHADGQPPMLIDAPSLNAAMRHVASKYFVGSRATQTQLVQALKAGSQVETVEPQRPAAPAQEATQDQEAAQEATQEQPT